MFESEAVSLPGGDDYKYYGASKDIPKVRELFEKVKKQQAPAKSYEELNRRVGFEYYQFNQGNSKKLLEDEKALENELRQKALEEYAEKHKISIDKLQDTSYKPVKRRKVDENEEFEILNDSDDLEEFENLHNNSTLQTANSNQLEVPVTPEDIKKLILKKKKEALIKKYASETVEQAPTEDTNLKISEV